MKSKLRLKAKGRCQSIDLVTRISGVLTPRVMDRFSQIISDIPSNNELVDGEGFDMAMEDMEWIWHLLGLKDPINYETIGYLCGMVIFIVKPIVVSYNYKGLTSADIYSTLSTDYKDFLRQEIFD